MFARTYAILSNLISPFLRLYLQRRVKQGKEDILRVKERFGTSPLTRLDAPYIWLHGASVGESMSLLPFIQYLHRLYPNLQFILTTGTLTAANLLRTKLPPNTIHQYVPLDVKAWVSRFLEHWKPTIAIMTESEVWPNICFSCKERNIPLYLINARLSEESTQNWLKLKNTSKAIFSCFTGILTIAEEYKERLEKLTDQNIELMPNLKFAANPLPFEEQELKTLKEAIKDRIVFVAASTHEGEEEIFVKTYKRLKIDMPNLLLVLAPRHLRRIEAIENLLLQHKIVFENRSTRIAPKAEDDVFLFDTMGELGLAYRLGRIAIVGGSFIPGIGGHNPIEPAALGICTFHGPYMENAKDIISRLEDCLIQVDEQTLEGALSFYLAHAKNAEEIGKNAMERILENKNGLKQLAQLCIPHLGDPNHDEFQPELKVYENPRVLVQKAE